MTNKKETKIVEPLKKDPMSKPRKSVAAVKLEALEKIHAADRDKALDNALLLQKIAEESQTKIGYLEDVIKKESSINKELRTKLANSESSFQDVTQSLETVTKTLRFSELQRKTAMEVSQAESIALEATEKELEEKKKAYSRLQAAALLVMQLPWYKRTYNNMSGILLKNL
jgi:pyruvate formate-lyase activating enzyme-like uncharacterized protein